MEFAIVAGLALVGYFMASDTPNVESTYMELPSQEVFPTPDKTFVQLQAEADNRARQQWKDAQDPHKTGVISPAYARAPTPYWSSLAKQTTSEKVKQTRMEMFTGATNIDTSQTGTYRMKQELPGMFSPTIGRMAVTSGGTGGNPQVQYRMPYVSGIQQNVLPAEQIQVGRGVGVGPEVPATDGFHPMYRALPKNVNAYRKNNLPGGVNVGASVVASRANDVVMEKHRPQTYWALERRPLAESKFVVDAHMRHATEPRLANNVCGGHYVGEETFGNPAYAFNQTRVSDAVTDATRPINNRNRNPQRHGQLNLTGEKAPHGLATSECAAHKRAVGMWDCARFNSQQREYDDTQPRNLRGPDGHMAPGGIRTNLTHRERSKEHYGGLGAYVDSGHMKWLQVPEVTLRQQVNHSAFGDAAPVLPAQTRQGADKQLMRHAKRSEQLVGTIKPPLLKKSDTKVVGAISMSKREGYNSQAGMPTPIATGREQVGHLTSSFNKLPIENPWAKDLGLVKQQLSGNALAHDIS